MCRQNMTDVSKARLLLAGRLLRLPLGLLDLRDAGLTQQGLLNMTTAIGHDTGERK